MPKREVKAGDYFLTPFAGTAQDRLVRAVEPGPAGHWYVTWPCRPNMGQSYMLLSSCHRCSPSRAARILGVDVPPAAEPVGWLDSFGELHKRREDAWDGDPDSTPPRPVYDRPPDGVVEGHVETFCTEKSNTKGDKC